MFAAKRGKNETAAKRGKTWNHNQAWDHEHLLSHFCFWLVNINRKYALNSRMAHRLREIHLYAAAANVNSGSCVLERFPTEIKTKPTSYKLDYSASLRP